MLWPLGLKRVHTTEQKQEVLQRFSDFVGVFFFFFFLLLILKESKLNFVSFFDGVQVK